MMGVFNLLAFRIQLRAENLHDTTDTREPDIARAGRHDGWVPLHGGKYRTPDGSYNDLSDPDMGMAGTRFARNVPLERRLPEPMPGSMEPNPREISRKLMRRDTFTPATSLNLLAAAWIQFQTHDWFAHGREHDGADFEIALARGRRLVREPDAGAAHRGRTTRGADDDRDLPPTYINTAVALVGRVEHLRQLERAADAVRTFTRRQARGRRTAGFRSTPRPARAHRDSARTGGSGSGMLHTLFTLEHNAICDAAEEASTRRWTTTSCSARRSSINAALHRQDPHRRVDAGDHRSPGAADRHARQLVGARRGALHRPVRAPQRERGDQRHPGVAQPITTARRTQLTEEFVVGLPAAPAAARRARDPLADGQRAARLLAFDEIILLNAERVLRERREGDGPLVLVRHPASRARSCLHNFPRWLQDLTLPDGVRLDLGAVDIIRDRERGVPRYNEFRRLLHLPPRQDVRGAHATIRSGRKELKEMYGRHRAASICRSACTPRRRPRVSASATPRSACSS